MSRYRKFVVALVGAALTAVEANVELLGVWGPTVVAALTALTVYLVPNAAVA